MELRRVAGGESIWRLEVAASWLARLRGLIGRKGLADGEGLYLPGTNGVHMLFMRFPIDCLFLSAPRGDGSRAVIAVCQHLAPWRGVVWWIRGAHGAVELPSGSVAAAGIKVGEPIWLAS
jgi:uncharacterized membrane protein (UPF0127 family)